MDDIFVTYVSRYIFL